MPIFSRLRSSVAAGLAAAVVAAAGTAIAQTAKPLSGNDVSILFPPPKTADDLANLIAVKDLAGPAGNPQPVWSTADFGRLLAIAENPEPPGAPNSGVNRIKLPADAKQIAAWFVAGIRIDPGAPGLSKAIIEQFGRQPQIRLIVQPVTSGPDGITVHDVAGHLIFSFGLKDSDPPLEGCAPLPRSKPDDEAFKAIVRDVAALRDELAAGKFGGVKVATAGELNVHPGLQGASAKPFRDALKAMLEKHLAPQLLTTGAVMGLDFPEPWIFVSMIKLPDGNFVQVPSPTLDGRQVAQMLTFRQVPPRVVPQPSTNNEKPITCRHASLQNPPLPKADRKGVSTAAFIGGNVGHARVNQIVNIIADPTKSHFFNTDCVSCHTETAQPLAKKVKNFAVPGVAKQVLPTEDWNVRNFGWFTSFLRGGPVLPTITRRTATETAEVVAFINSQLLNK